VEKTQKEVVKEYVKANPGKTAVQIAKATGIRGANVSSVLVKGFYAEIFKRERPDADGSSWVYFVSEYPANSSS
jgi:DNA-binding MarR family transcriptional regulator